MGSVSGSRGRDSGFLGHSTPLGPGQCAAGRVRVAGSRCWAPSLGWTPCCALLARLSPRHSPSGVLPPSLSRSLPSLGLAPLAALSSSTDRPPCECPCCPLDSTPILLAPPRGSPPHPAELWSVLALGPRPFRPAHPGPSPQSQPLSVQARTQTCTRVTLGGSLYRSQTLGSRRRTCSHRGFSCACQLGVAPGALSS